MLRQTRSILAPILFRVQLRISSAIDHSQTRRVVDQTASDVQTLDLRLAKVEQRLGALDRLAEIEQRLGAIKHGLASGHAQMAELRDLTREVIYGTSFRMELLRDFLDARTAGLREQISATSGALGTISDTLGTASNTLETVEQYGALLLQRNAVPLPGAIAVRTSAGYILTPPEDEALVVALTESRGRMEPGTLDVMLALLSEGMTVIDVGANVGGLALPAARAVGPSGRVLALEAAPRIANLLQRTAAMNGAHWVSVETTAAGDMDGLTRFHLSIQTTHNSMLPVDDEAETIETPVCRLDSLVAPGDRVDLIKIDVEGAELQVWRGAQRIVADNPDVAVILEFGPSHLRNAGVPTSAWFDELQADGMKAWEIDEASSTVRPLRASGLEDVFTLNILLMRGSPASRGLAVS